MKKICDICKNPYKEFFIKSIYYFQSLETDIYYYVCKSCYTNISKEMKKKLVCLEGKEKVSGWLGFILFGVIGYLGFKSGALNVRLKQRKQFNLGQNELDSLSIDRYDRHYYLLNSDQQDKVVCEIIRLKKKQNPELDKPMKLWKSIPCLVFGILLLILFYYTFFLWFFILGIIGFGIGFYEIVKFLKFKRSNTQ